jgi:hypothetical protein
VVTVTAATTSVMLYVWCKKNKKIKNGGFTHFFIFRDKMNAYPLVSQIQVGSSTDAEPMPVSIAVPPPSAQERGGGEGGEGGEGGGVGGGGGGSGGRETLASALASVASSSSSYDYTLFRIRASGGDQSGPPATGSWNPVMLVTVAARAVVAGVEVVGLLMGVAGMSLMGVVGMLMVVVAVVVVVVVVVVAAAAAVA